MCFLIYGGSLFMNVVFWLYLVCILVSKFKVDVLNIDDIEGCFLVRIRCLCVKKLELWVGGGLFFFFINFVKKI